MTTCISSNFLVKIVVLVKKPTTSAKLVTGLANSRPKTSVIDFEVGLRNLDLILWARLVI